MFPNTNDFSMENMMQFYQENPNFQEVMIQAMKNEYDKISSNPREFSDKNEIIESMKKEIEMAQKTEKKTRKTVPFYPAKKIRQIRAMEYGIARTNGNQINAFKQTYVTANKHSSKIENLSKLKPIYINSLLVNKINYGQYLICRVIEVPYQILASTLLVEDENGDIEDVSIYNYSSNESCLDLFQIGTVIYIKEPFLKITRDGYGRCIRVDSPSDILIDDYQYSGKFRNQLNQLKISNNPEVLKQKGNDYYLQKKYDLAIRCYKIALNLNPKQPELLNLNLSAAYLGLELYSQAYLGADKALSLITSETSKTTIEKAKYRMGISAYRMRQWETALRYITDLLKDNTSNKEAQALLREIMSRIKEKQTGNYNFLEIYLKYINENNYNLDIADYHNQDLLLLQENPSKGRHILAQNNIARGTLLIVSKAFSFGIWNEKENKIPIYSTNLVKNTIDTPSQYENVTNLFKKVHGNPFLAKEVYSLYSGNQFDRNEALPDNIVDVSRLECISSFNSFAGEGYGEFFKNSGFTKKEFEKISRENIEKSTGIWLYPSLLNHSCIPNTARYFFGDIMIIFSAKDIKKDEEITTAYVSSLNSYDERQKHIEYYLFKCDCELCEIERKDPNRKEREKIIENSDEIAKIALDIEKISNLQKAIDKTYDQNAKYKFALLKPLKLRENYLYINGRFLESAKISIICYEMLKDVLPDLALMSAICIKKCYDKAKQNKKSEKWGGIILKDDFFHNEDILKIRYKKVLS